MAPDFDRLAKALQAACGARGWLQEDLIRESGAGRSTIQRLWGGKGATVPNRTTQAQIEHTFGWAPRSVETVLNGGEPTLLSESPDAATSAEKPHAATAERRDSTLPVRIRQAIESRATYETEEIEFPELHLIVIAKVGEYEDIEILRRQAAEWAAIQRAIRDAQRRTDTPSEPQQPQQGQ